MNFSRNLLLLLGLCALAACDGQDAITTAGDASGASDEVVFHRGNGGEPGSLDPHRNEDDWGANILRDLYEGLTTEDALSRVVPGTARSWTISDDGLVYTFELRSDARWSNGDPLVAQDFVAGLRRTVDPATGSPYAQILYPIVNAERIATGMVTPDALGVRALSNDRLEITLHAPTSYFLGLLTHWTAYPIHRPSLAAHGNQFTRPGNLVSNGAYRLSEWVVQSHIRLDRNEFFWDNDAVRIDVVYYHATEDTGAELRRYRADELDFTYQIPNAQFAWITENLGSELHTGPYLSTYFYGFDLTEPPLTDVRIRQALSMAVDRETLTLQVTGNGEEPAYSWVPPGVNNYPGTRYAWSDLDNEERANEARRLYREAGYSEDNPLEIEIRYNTNENHQRIALAIASMWKEALGASVTILNEEFQVLLQTRFLPAQWDIIRFGWFGDYNDAYTFLEILRTGHGQNFMGYSDAEYDRLTAAATLELDAERRRDLLLNAEQRMLDGYPLIPLYFYVNKHLVKPHVQGFQSNIMNRYYSRHYRIERN